jgi:rhamnosyltransferase
MTGVSIIIRTLNEAGHLQNVLQKITEQQGDFVLEFILIDSNSTDNTLEVACRYKCRVLQLPRAEFSWGKALNMGLEAAINEYCILLSGHCPPVDNLWLGKLLGPLAVPNVAATCGRQIPVHGVDPFEEAELERWFPQLSANVPYLMFTSANSAVKRSTWRLFGFSETINSLEDAELSAKLKKMRYDIIYIPGAAVYHSHPVSLPGIYRRWYWRSRVGMFLRKDTNPRIVKASKSRFIGLAPLGTVLSSYLWFFSKSIQICFARGYITSLWKLPFYELARQYANYLGLRDGLTDVRHGEAPGRFCYYQSKIPRLVSALRFIEK